MWLSNLSDGFSVQSYVSAYLFPPWALKDHFTIVWSVTWPLNTSEADGEHLL